MREAREGGPPQMACRRGAERGGAPLPGGRKRDTEASG